MKGKISELINSFLSSSGGAKRSHKHERHGSFPSTLEAISSGDITIHIESEVTSSVGSFGPSESTSSFTASLFLVNAIN